MKQINLCGNNFYNLFFLLFFFPASINKFAYLPGRFEYNRFSGAETPLLVDQRRNHLATLWLCGRTQLRLSESRPSSNGLRDPRMRWLPDHHISRSS